MSILVRLLGLMACVLLFSCTPVLYQGTVQYVHTKGADLPVWVRGNLEGGTALVFLHGGPGGSAFPYAALAAMQELEKSYAVVYWDQRLAGNNEGNAPEDTLTFDQMADDARTVVRVVQSLYAFKSVFLLGHSWGGGLGTLALADPIFQSEIRGWIEVDGAHDTVHSDPLSRQWVIDVATASLSANPQGEDAQYWKGALDWFASRPVLSGADFAQFSTYLSKAGAYGDTSAANSTSLPLLFESPTSLGALENSYVAGRLTVRQWDFSAQLAAIHLPTRLIWGAHDGRIPVAAARTTLDQLGTVTGSKDLVILDHSGHSPMIDDPEGFKTAVQGFIEQYRSSILGDSSKIASMKNWSDQNLSKVGSE